MFDKKFPGILRSVFAAATLAASICAHSATVFETTQLAGATRADDAALPQPISFQIATAGSYTVTLTDLRTPEFLGSLRAIVTRDLAKVAELEVTYPAAPSIPTATTASFIATPGSYRIHVLGIPAAAGAGGFGVSVAPAAGGASVVDHADVIAAESAPAGGQSALQENFDIAQAGTYQLTVTDHAFPAALASTQILLLRETDSGPVVVNVVGGAFTAAPGTYQLVIVATASAPSLAGLYSVRVDTGPASPVIYQSLQPVGTLPPATPIAIATAGQYSLTLADVGFPAALTSFAVTITQGNSLLATRTAAGTTSVSMAQGVAQLFAFGVPAPAAGVGAFSINLAQGSQALYAQVHLADASEDATTPAIYAFSPTAPVAAGSYQVTLKDFAIPLGFTSLKAAVVQGTTLLATLNGAESTDVALQAGAAKVLVSATPPASAGNALFGLQLATKPAGAVVLESTQGVGGLFRTHIVPVAVAGPYDLTLRDLGFPLNMTTTALAITRGTTLIGQVIGGGILPRQELAAGTYVLNLLGQPAANAGYGTYGLRIADSPPRAVVTLTANPASITSGQQTTLQWSATAATACTASGGWNGSKAVSGSQSVGPLSANATFDLSCIGPGGTGTATVAVTVNAPSASKGGGGATSPWLLLCMCALVGALGFVRQWRAVRLPSVT